MSCTCRLLGRALLLCGWALSGCEASSSPALPPPAQDAGVRMLHFNAGALHRLGLRVEDANGVSASHALRVPGTLDYDLDHYAEVGTLLEGRVSKLQARIGERVKKGQPLATIVVPSIANAQADYLTTHAAVGAARKNLAREDDLLAKQLTTAREAEVAHSEAAKAEAELAAATAKLKALRVIPPEDGTAIARAGDYTITAPLSGVVVRRDAVLGSFLAPSQMAFAVADLSELWATLEVYEADLPYLRLGASVAIVFDSIPNQIFSGTVTLLEPQVGKASRAVRARVVVPNANEELRPGLFLRARIELPHTPSSDDLLIPSAAVQPLGGHDVVFVEHGPGAFEVRPVKVNRQTADVAEISEGIAKGERIVVEGAFLLRGEATKQ